VPNDEGTSIRSIGIECASDTHVASKVKARKSANDDRKEDMGLAHSPVATRFYLSGAIGGDRHHRHSDRPAVAGRGIPPSRLPCHSGSWAVALFPYIQQQALADQWADSGYYAQPEHLRTVQIPLLYCPTRRGPDGVSKDGDTAGDHGVSVQHHPGALGDYAANVGDGSNSRWDWAYTTETNRQPNGPMVHAGGPYDHEGEPNRLCRGSYPDWYFDKLELRLTFASVRDGLSNTVFVGERHVPIDKFGTQSGYDTSIYNSDHMLHCCGRFGGPGYGLARSASDPPGGNFGSYHPGLCQFVFGDGSVRALSNQISTTTLRSLCVRNDGEVIPGDAIQ